MHQGEGGISDGRRGCKSEWGKNNKLAIQRPRGRMNYQAKGYRDEEKGIVDDLSREGTGGSPEPTCNYADVNLRITMRGAVGEKGTRRQDKTRPVDTDHQTTREHRAGT
jgi:hypothetical protein